MQKSNHVTGEEDNYRCTLIKKILRYIYVISEEIELDIIKSLTPMDFSTAVPNDHKGMEHEILYIFGKDINLLERFGDKERTVSLYIKFNKISDQYLFVISFHEQEHPLSYYFK